MLRLAFGFWDATASDAKKSVQLRRQPCFWTKPLAQCHDSPPLPTLVLQENEAWEGGVYARVAVPQPDSDETGSSGVNVTLAVALSVCLVAAVVVVGVAAKYIQRKVRAILSLLRPLPVPPLLLLRFHPPARPEL